LSKIETTNKIISDFRKNRKLSLQDFTDQINAYLGEDVYSKDAIYRMDSKGAKVSADFMMHVANTFDVPIEILYAGKAVIEPQDIKNPPPIHTGGSIEHYRQFITHAKGLVGDNPSPIMTEVLAKFSQALDDCHKVNRQNDYMRGMVDAAQRFVRDALEGTGKKKGK